MFEVINILGLTEISKVITLADGSDSFFALFNGILKNPRVYYNTLLTPEVDKRMGADFNYPPSGLNLTNLDNHELWP